VALLTQLRFYVHILNGEGWHANSMNFQGQRDLLLLAEVERDGAVTQRSLSAKHGVALGLTNLSLKRLARKGHIKITTTPSPRVRYVLTPQGFAENSRLAYLYMEYSLSHYCDMPSAATRNAVSSSQQRNETRCHLWNR
jgi:predicted transcriptional regulator